MGFIYCKHHTNTKDKHKQTHNKQLLARVEHKKGQKPNRSMTDVCLPEQNISPRVQLCITLNKCSHCRINQHVHNRKENQHAQIQKHVTCNNYTWKTKTYKHYSHFHLLISQSEASIPGFELWWMAIGNIPGPSRGKLLWLMFREFKGRTHKQAWKHKCNNKNLIIQMHAKKHKYYKKLLMHIHAKKQKKIHIKKYARIWTASQHISGRSEEGKGSLPFSDIYRGTKSPERVCKHTDSTHQENIVICMNTWVFVEDTLTNRKAHNILLFVQWLIRTATQWNALRNANVHVQ